MQSSVAAAAGVAVIYVNEEEYGVQDWVLQNTTNNVTDRWEMLINYDTLQAIK